MPWELHRQGSLSPSQEQDSRDLKSSEKLRPEPKSLSFKARASCQPQNLPWLALCSSQAHSECLHMKMWASVTLKIKHYPPWRIWRPLSSEKLRFSRSQSLAGLFSVAWISAITSYERSHPQLFVAYRSNILPLSLVLLFEYSKWGLPLTWVIWYLMPRWN